jgi:hypothetical protein
LAMTQPALTGMTAQAATASVKVTSGAMRNTPKGMFEGGAHPYPLAYRTAPSVFPNAWSFCTIRVVGLVCISRHAVQYLLI